ncbi:cytochrome P450 [Calothrix sp. UHCC 0171]|uniref:cytochrome P450 n=1 Tax=Calothrix sp. UHCC 0171 TaxID=3110245 RepID=UPI002B1FD8C3|nr:cytochrome P450 [Calothrix sp. UHCC 0171]MEA5573344.1 cytochrome P450 [Calothrix sp. UHCC 0171]
MKLPNGPQSPAIAQMLQWVAIPMSLMTACAKRYGDIFTLNLTIPIVIVSNPQALQQILTGDTKEFSAPSDWNKQFESLLGKNSVITIAGEAHKRQRQLLTPAFHGEMMQSHAKTIRNITEEIIQSCQENKTFCVRSVMQQITLRVIMQAVFGLYAGDRAQELERVLSAIMDAGANSPLRTLFLYYPALQRDLGKLTPWGTFLRRREYANQLIYAEIRERRQNFDASRTDILSLLMAARDENGEAMTDEELRDELMTLLTAGHETTATALTWALYWIHKFPSVRYKLLEELQNLGDEFDINTIHKLPYLNAVCNETLRIYPVGMLTFPREVKEAVNLCGYDLEPGTILMGSIYLTHQRPDIYPEPQIFKPERFLERQFSPYEFLPFGGGVRRCIGNVFALFEMKIVLTTILSKLDLELVTKQDVKPQRRGLVTGPNQQINLMVKGKR